MRALRWALLTETAAEPDDGTNDVDYCGITVSVRTGEHSNQMLESGRCNIQGVSELLAMSGGHGHCSAHDARSLKSRVFSHGDASIGLTSLPLEHSGVGLVPLPPPSLPPSLVMERGGVDYMSGGGGGWELNFGELLTWWAEPGLAATCCCALGAPVMLRTSSGTAMSAQSAGGSALGQSFLDDDYAPFSGGAGKPAPDSGSGGANSSNDNVPRPPSQGPSSEASSPPPFASPLLALVPPSAPQTLAC